MTRLIAAVFALVASCGTVNVGISSSKEIPTFRHEDKKMWYNINVLKH